MKDGRKVAIGVGLVVAVAGILLLTAWKKPGPPEPPPPGVANLYGFITDAETGEPIVGVDMTVYQDYDTETVTSHATTNSQGYYEVLNMLVEVDVTMMVVYASGYETYTNENVPITEGNNNLNIQMVPE